MNYFIYGSEGYLLKKELNKVIKSDDLNDHLNAVYYDGMASDFNIEQIIEDANTISMFAEKKVIIVNNPSFLFNQSLSDEQLAAFEQYLHDSSVFTTLIFYVETNEQNSIDQRKKIFKMLVKECRTIHIGSLNTDEFRKVVINDLNKNKIAIDKDAVEELIARLPIDIANWKTELSKIQLYGKSINKDDIRFLIARSLDDNVFIMVNAVMRHNLKLAIEAWRDLAIMKHDPIELIAILASQFRFMYQCGILAHKYDNKQIADILNAKVARVNITMNNSRNVSTTQIMALLAKLADLDQKIKMGIIDKQLGFELFLIEATR